MLCCIEDKDCIFTHSPMCVKHCTIHTFQSLVTRKIHRHNTQVGFEPTTSNRYLTTKPLRLIEAIWILYFSNTFMCLVSFCAFRLYEIGPRTQTHNLLIRNITVLVQCDWPFDHSKLRINNLIKTTDIPSLWTWQWHHHHQFWPVEQVKKSPVYFLSISFLLPVCMHLQILAGRRS